VLNRIGSWWKQAATRIPPNVVSDPDFQFLQQNSLISELSPAAMLFLHSRVVQRRYSRREMIFRDQNPGVCMFLIRQGGVELFVEDDDDNAIRLAELAPGALFGEIATATGYARTASARASKSDTLLLSISRFDLEDLNRNYPQDGLLVQRGITLSVIDSLIATTSQLGAAQRKIEELRLQLARRER
jgi:CRP-like cAMP-binding protein